ncbi:MAG: SDR family oxidoreductase [Anaerolineales bacterium]|nr:SDR family oxidoreductase [Anaerolineales bacterium]
MNKQQKVLVVGATGYLGQFVVKALKEAGYWVRALSRTEQKIEAVRPFIDDLFIGEATNPASLTGICDNIDIVFSSLGITRQKDGLTYMDVDYQANKNILDLALAAQVQQFMYISALHADKLHHVQILAAKERFVDELMAANIDHLIIRPNGFFSDMSAFLDMARNGRVYLFGNGENRANPIHGADLAQACVEHLQKPGGEYDIGGPELLTQNEIARQAFAAAGKPAKITHIPLWVKDVTVWLAKTFTSVKTYGPMEFFMTVLAMDMVAPMYGQHTLKAHFETI